MEKNISKTISQLSKNNFEVFFAENLPHAKNIFIEEILKSLNIKTVSYGDSITLHSSGILEFLKNISALEFIDTFEGTWREQIYKRKQALTVDLFLTGCNAVTENGQLVNLDMIGNRIAPLSFGPKTVVLLIGKNKIVPDLNEAFNRVRNIAAPLNVKRHGDLKTPCQKTGKCHNCQSPQRICNSWSILEKCYPSKRIKIILINEDIGF